jgi:hypothetical protein
MIGSTREFYCSISRFTLLNYIHNTQENRISKPFQHIINNNNNNNIINTHNNKLFQKIWHLRYTEDIWKIYPAFVLCPSCIPEKVYINQNSVNPKWYSHQK